MIVEGIPRPPFRRAASPSPKRPGRRQRVLALVRAAGSAGISSVEVCRELGIKVTPDAMRHVSSDMGCLRRDGIEDVRSVYGRWYCKRFQAAPVLVPAWVSQDKREYKPTVPVRGAFNSRHLIVIATLKEYEEVGGATADDIMDALHPDRFHTPVQRYNIYAQLLPYMVAKGAVIERRGDRFFLLGLP